MMRYLIQEIGVEPREAEMCLVDGDLWPRIEPAAMFPFEGQEAVDQWEDAVDYLSRLYEFHLYGNPAILQIILEGSEVAEEQLKRARERVEAASG